MTAPHRSGRPSARGAISSPEGARRAITTAIERRSSVDLDDFGQRLAKRLPGYRLGEPLGVGGMGAVYRALDEKLDREVAIKALLPPTDPSQAKPWRQRFEREAITMAKLSHPNILTVYDFGQDDELAWIVLEFVDGANLRDLLEDGALGQDEAFDVATQLGAALEYAHERGIIHRDVKPENVLVTERGHVKVADFGIAKVDDPNFETLTKTDQAMGSMAYLAPEVLQSGSLVDNRADVYAFGAVVYEMLTGHQSMGNFALPSSTTGVDPDLDEPILRALDPDPNTRTATVGDTVRAIRQLREARAQGRPSFRASALRAAAEEFHVRVSWLVVAACAFGIASLGLIWVDTTSATYHGWDIGQGTIAAFAFGLPVVVRIALGSQAPRRLLASVDLAAGAAAITFALHPLWQFGRWAMEQRVEALESGAWLGASCGALLVVQALLTLAFGTSDGTGASSDQRMEDPATRRRPGENARWD